MSDSGATQARCLGSPPSPTVGKGCGCTRDCDPGTACLTESTDGVPGGWCVKHCTTASDCPAGFACRETTDGDPGTSTCLQLCNKPDDCRAGNLCQVLGTELTTYCFPYCQSDADCPVTHHCDRYYGTCVDQPRPGNGEIGDACKQDQDCKSSFCITEGLVSSFTGGYCTAFCSLSKQGCPSGSVCALKWSTAGDSGICMTSCTASTTCRSGYQCLRSPDATGVTACGTKM
jgi:hypothetical protein